MNTLQKRFESKMSLRSRRKLYFEERILQKGPDHSMSAFTDKNVILFLRSKILGTENYEKFCLQTRSTLQHYD